jgi:hypothetical protein
MDLRKQQATLLWAPIGSSEAFISAYGAAVLRWRSQRARRRIGTALRPCVNYSFKMIARSVRSQERPEALDTRGSEPSIRGGGGGSDPLSKTGLPTARRGWCRRPSAGCRRDASCARRWIGSSGLGRGTSSLHTGPGSGKAHGQVRRRQSRAWFER